MEIRTRKIFPDNIKFIALIQEKRIIIDGKSIKKVFTGDVHGVKTAIVNGAILTLAEFPADVNISR